MELKDEREVEVTREKLSTLEAHFREVNEDPRDDAHIQELTLRSLKRIINQMKEEIARFRIASVLASNPIFGNCYEELIARRVSTVIVLQQMFM